MKVIDLTQTIKNDMPVYPGTIGPELTVGFTVPRDGFQETLLAMYSHTGTHMDAPAHVYEGRLSLDELPASHFVGKALLVDCREFPAGSEIPLSKIQALQPLADQAEFLVFMTGWSRLWGSPDYFGEYPVPSAEICQYAIDSGKKGICMDYIGLDPISDTALVRHHQVLAHDMVIVENLTNLEEVYAACAAEDASAGGCLFTLAVLPVKYEKADGAPIRAVALV